ncbi:MAG: hypothetical protein FJX54_21685 [Alphaproteobacteria bacterium]|nr:hypothetical protein [Alphaproteobacteria bacterium]
MTSTPRSKPSRRSLLATGAALAATAAWPRVAFGQRAKIKIGLMLPYSGVFAQIAENITFAVDILLDEQGRRLGGREVEIVKVDDESNPAKGTENASRLVRRDEVDVLIGTVHSGVQMGIMPVVRESGTLLIIPNSGNNGATRELCAPNIFRVSFTNWQPAYGMGKALAGKGVKRAAFVTWDYAAGAEAAEAFGQAIAEGGGQLVQVLKLPFPDTSFQPLLAQIPGLGLDAVGAFFASGGAVQFVKDYAAAGLKARVPLCGVGFLTEGTLSEQGPAAWGGARFPETAHCATDRKDGGRAWTEIMGWNRV